MKLNRFYRVITFLLLATFSFSSSIAYPDIPQVLAKGDRLPKINLFPFSRDSLTKLKATAQTEFVRSELRNMLGFPKENAFPFRNPRRRARLIDLSSFSPSPLYIKQGKDRNEGVLVRSELRSNAESDHSKSSFNWWWIAAPFQMLAQMARRLWLQIQQKTRTRNKIIMISARTIFRTFDANQIAVQQITRRAKSRFETHDQRGSLRDEKNRRELYQHVMDKVVHDLQVRTPNSLSDFKFWHDLKASYSELIKDRYDQDKARIFFNSVARRFLSADVTRVMYTPDEILQSEKRKQAPTPIFKTYLKGTENTNQVVSEVFSDYPFAIRYRDLASDIQHVTEKIEEFLVGTLQSKDFYALEILEPLALRDGKAYLIGYIVADKERLLIIPCVIQLDNQEEFNQGGKQVGVFVSNVFLGKQLAGNIFTFSRSGFYIDTPYYRELVEFLERAAPRKASYELYWNIGDHPHARSKFYELLQLHLKEDGAQFTSVTELQKPSQDPIIAFTLPGFDNVFQLVRSHDQKGKAVDREVVKKRYDYVLQTDRKGWLLGGLKFGELKFRQSAFSEPLLQVLRTEASYKDSDVVFEGDFVIFKLLYVQNRVFPLNEFLKQDQSREEQVKAIRSFGDFVRGLAEAGVFYGNYDLSKVAITAYGKVVGFDYSMLGAIGRYHFSDSRAKGRRTAAKIPQEFLASFIPSSLLPVFQETHGDLLTAKFWNQMKWTRQISGEIHSAFNTYLKEFGEITSRAQSRFENRDWRGVVDDVREKLELYPHALDQMLNRFQSVFAHISDDEWKSEEFWLSIKEKYAEQVAHQYDADLAFIFFYSVMRRVLARYGIPVEYGDDGIVENREISIDQPLYRAYEQERNETVGQLLKRIVLNFGLQAPFQNLDQDVSVASNILAGDLQKKFGSTAFERIEILKPLFFRNKGAYVIGRIKVNGEWMPLVLPLIHKEKGIKIHAVLTDRSDVSNVFSFTRSSFQVDSSRYREMIDFLETIMPSKGKTALYSSIGFIQPAKIQFIKELRDHLQRTGEHFVPTEGIAGTVMSTFTLPTFPYVFKVINQIGSTNPEAPNWDPFKKEHINHVDDVAAKYRMVHMRERAGRMLDALVLRNVEFPEELFPEDLLTRLVRFASFVSHKNGKVRFSHQYDERKVHPLDVIFKEMDRKEAERTVIDLGQAMKDLAYSGMFTSDFDFKNSGRTEYGRVVGFDKDEVMDLLELHFVNEFPPNLDHRGIHFHKHINPAHLLNELGIPEEYRDLFVKHHGDMLKVDFWKNIQKRLRRGEILDFFPYPKSRYLDNWRRQNHKPASGRSELRKVAYKNKVRTENVPSISEKPRRGNKNIQNASGRHSRVRSELRELLMPNDTLPDRLQGIGLSRKDGFEIMTSKLLVDLARSELRVVVIAPTRSELRFLAEANLELPDRHKIFAAKSFKQAAALLHQDGRSELRFITTERAWIPFAEPYFDIIEYLPLNDFLQWLMTLPSKLVDAVRERKAAYLAAIST